MQRLPTFENEKDMMDFLVLNGMTGTSFRSDVALLMTKWFYHTKGEDMITPFLVVINNSIEMWAMGYPLGRQHVFRIMSCVLHGVMLWTCDGYNNGEGLGVSSAESAEDHARADLLDQYIRDLVWSDDQVEEVLQRYTFQ